MTFYRKIFVIFLMNKEQKQDLKVIHLREWVMQFS